MSTEKTVLCAMCLCLAFRGASCNAITVLTSRAARHPEVPCALTLMPPLFQRVENVSAAYAPRLYVFGFAVWLDEFLRRFPSVASIYVFNDEDVERSEKMEAFFEATMLPSRSVVLFVEGPESWIYRSNQIKFLYNIPIRVRMIHWQSEDLTIKADVAINGFLQPLKHREHPLYCHIFVLVMITARQRGTTHVFKMSLFCDWYYSYSKATYDLLGYWSPAVGWSGSGVSLFPPLCLYWQPHPDGRPLLAEKIIQHHDQSLASRPELWQSKASETLGWLRGPYGLVFQTRVHVTSDKIYTARAAETCRLGFIGYRHTLSYIEAKTDTELVVFPWRARQPVIMVVPAAAGKPLPVLYSITAEYTPAVWAALAGAGLAVVACLYLMRSDKSVQELVFLTLSPLLGQPLDEGPGGPQIAVLGGWLMTCVVVSASYQGQLLSFITDPPKNREINSWEEWLESDLVLFLPDTIITLDGLKDLTLERISYTRSVPPQDQILNIANQRNGSRLMIKHDYDNFMMVQTEELRNKLHTFIMPNWGLVTTGYFTTKGSPFEVPLRRLLGRARAAGLSFDPDPSTNATKHLQQGTDQIFPITLLNIRPIISVYIVGNLIAVSFLMLEFFLSKITSKTSAN
ncbi:Ionotropic receptor 252 [Frankliniella occidentalis]|nr:Ionotropic receptor 252 [Frankliniella occidentalis]